MKKKLSFQSKKVARGSSGPAYEARIGLNNGRIDYIYGVDNNHMTSNAGYLYRAAWNDPTKLKSALKFLKRNFPESIDKIKNYT